MFGLKYIFVWLLANYSYDNLVKTYNAYNNENTFDSMSKFIEKQQYREDQLREQCNLQYYKIKDKPTMYDDFKYAVKETYNDVSTVMYTFNPTNLISTLNIAIPSLYIMDSIDKIYSDSLEDFLSNSHNSDNINRDIVLNGITYKLIKPGYKISSAYISYSNQHHMPTPQNPTWEIILGNQTLTITDIK